MLLILPILFPLLGMLFNAFIGRKLGNAVVSAVATLAVAASFVVSLILFVQGVTPEHPIEVEYFPWIAVGRFQVPFGLLVDSLSVTLMLIITGIGGLIHLYSIGYMAHDPRQPRYFVYLNLFVASMLVLVMANNFLLMFVGWELVGLCSYLLIGFWFENVKNAEAGRKAFVANRIGDVGFALGIMLIFATFGTLTFKEVFEIAETNKAITTLIFTLITLLLFVGATGKSAQIPLFVWLPDAMAGPTPVSALIHAATMVTAGIYMMTRAHVLFEHAPFTQHTVATIGALTAFVAGYAAITQWDIKKVLAYSTVSQLGFMVAAAGLGAYVASHFHLLTHAFFKALLFLGAGSVIHGMEHFAHVTHDPSQRLSDPQDMRNMGALRKKMPITFVTFVIGGLALAGVPPFAGFWSKDEIVAAALHHNLFVFVLLTFTAFFTAFYVGRQLLLVFWGRARTEDASYAQESAPTMTIALMVLAFFAVIAGLINLPANFPMAGWLAHWLEPMLGAHESEPMNFVLAGAFTLLSIGALALAALVYRRKYHWATQPDPLERFGALYTLSRRKWYFDEAYRTLFIIPFYAASSFLARVFDLGGIDAIVNGVGEFVRDSANGLRRVQNGFVRSYGLVMLLGVAAILAYLLLAAR